MGAGWGIYAIDRDVLEERSSNISKISYKNKDRRYRLSDTTNIKPFN